MPALRRPQSSSLPRLAALLLLSAGLLPPGLTQAVNTSANASAARGSVVHDRLGQAYVYIPAGSFLMGTELTEEQLQAIFARLEPRRISDLSDERPAHRVTLSSGFYLGRFEVTVGAFADFLAQSGYVPESVADGTGAYGYNPRYDRERPVQADAFEGRSPKYSWNNPGFAQTRAHPVTNVSLKDALAMADWLSRQEGVRYRLPSEAEWEYSCRAGSTTLFPAGNQPESLALVANTFDASATAHWLRWSDQALSENDGFAFTAPVGQYQPNAFGLYDMVGNVWEWTSDRYEQDSYARPAPATAPADSDAPFVRRGGSWHTWAIYARCGFRNYNTASSRYPLLGFRLLREAGASAR